mmetsp:Transcript_23258/g.42818  ORF Transcript_23258/g.42818 Transcript_23258/m.42818 type:complete len:109 (+) Transcript_23258:821-1147(+)|eukprot:CAMPEP_0202027124 /NCGR_PEP_ID=MMETSP0905-20130828/60702_1 /ASSEMBLY_ACC=CAM_ASM_000554 /TAXON_ID=420261 /ORGANISM="Thalassiosira antarctica, Strain CCMP982" /LENGTH=108 /DNA_ID=CAMNT_0048590527 /DNA_START=573 /DNA_END=899 /DNA_ORIENTATION=+
MAFCEKVYEDLASLLGGSTTELLKHHTDKDCDRAMGSALKEFLGIITATKSNVDLEDALDNIEFKANPYIESMIEEIAKRVSGKENMELSFVEVVAPPPPKKKMKSLL